MIVGIDIGGTNIKGVLTDRRGEVLSFKKTETPEKGADIIKSILDLIENLATSASVSKIDIEAIGIGSAGSIDRAKGMIISSPNIKAFKRFPLGKTIEKKTGIRVFLENDATAALLGAWWKGNGNKFRNWIMVTLGTGIGGGVIIDNKIYTGQSGNAMEIGHMSIDFQGRECSCGSRGCLELYASATALVELARRMLEHNSGSSLHKAIEEGELTAKMIHQEALNKDELSLQVFEETATHLGYGIANLVNIFNPEAIIFGGGLSEAHKLILPTVKRIVSKRALPGLKENIKYLPIKDFSIIPALGAARIALDASASEG